MDFLKEHAVAAIAAAVALAVCVYVAVSCMGWASEEAAAKAEADGALASAEQAVEQAEDDVVAVARDAEGVDVQRVSRDEALLREVFETTFTWDSFATYREARSKLVDEYGVPADSWFMTRYMPEVEEYTKVDGIMSNTIDEHGYEMSFSDMEVRVLGVEGGTYTYLAQIDAVTNYRDSAGHSLVAAVVEVASDGSMVSADLLPAV